ncbi:sialidase family protein [Brachybacterium sacelli]|uniref:Sialidase domain-containing protein n=1 Tax=Brachybacterium sacelli TaxID=173364 RepID=A0ABS4X0E2_9MICO|nr:sialidase family protein [Brachybacterium sacelli]MBP2381910.1 hypothetical protein [Brachybacterium sacelli]
MRATDDGATWVRKRAFQPGACQYSALLAIGRDEYALLYEGPDEAITFACLDLDWILSR